MSESGPHTQRARYTHTHEERRQRGCRRPSPIETYTQQQQHAPPHVITSHRTHLVVGFWAWLRFFFCSFSGIVLLRGALAGFLFHPYKQADLFLRLEKRLRLEPRMQECMSVYFSFDVYHRGKKAQWTGVIKLDRRDLYSAMLYIEVPDMERIWSQSIVFLL